VFVAVFAVAVGGFESSPPSHQSQPACNQLAGLLIGGHRLSKHLPKQANGASIPLLTGSVDD
jgi:hypothetical protein